MRLGLIARDEVARGLALQSLGIYQAIPFDKVLLVRMPKPDCDLGEGWYPDATIVQADRNTSSISEREARSWLEDLDVVFTVETPYHWQFPRWARQAGAKLVIQGNPEFYKHGQKDCDDRAQPDEWWWPTSWKPVPEIPDGRLMPVPMPDDVPASAGDPTADGPLRVLHVVGKRAHGDRNGSDIVANAMRFIEQPVHLTMFGLDGQLPDIPKNRMVTTEMYPNGVADRWSMYEGQHVHVLPRRYGGLCLTALESEACGIPVVMPDLSPNAELAGVLLPVSQTVPMLLPCGQVTTAKMKPIAIASWINRVAQDRQLLVTLGETARQRVPRWAQWRQRYLDAFTEVARG